MANKDLFKQAIAEAKSVREAAIANAKEALEETLTPHLKDMLAAKLQEMEDSQSEEEVVNEVEEEDAMEENMSGFNSVEEAEEEAEDDSEESEDEAEVEAGEEEGEEEEMEAEEDQELGDLSVEDFKNLIRDIIAQEMGAGEAEPEMGADMDAGAMEPEMGSEDEEEIDLDELLRELEGVYEMSDDKEEMEKISHNKDEMKEAQISEVGESLEAILAALGAAGALVGSAEGIAAAARAGKLGKTLKTIMSTPRRDSGKPGFAVESDLAEAMETIETLKAQLSEVNLLNAKLLYVNKVFKANNLTESQKVNIIAAFDKAETVKEVKLVFETVSESVVVKKETATIKENKLGMASKATGTTASQPQVIAEVSDAVRRMQKLAGII